MGVAAAPEASGGSVPPPLQQGAREAASRCPSTPTHPGGRPATVAVAGRSGVGQGRPGLAAAADAPHRRG